MSNVRDGRTSMRRVLAIAVLMALGLALLPAATAGRTGGRVPAPPEPTTPPAPEAPQVHGTPANLQAAFTNEINAQERYKAFAARAEVDSQPGVARLFRACAMAESVHAKRFVQAIAWTNQTARALLEKLTVGTTEQNLQAAIGLEQYEIDTWYPALLERARAEGPSMAVRSISLALGAERTHVALLREALDGLPDRPALATLHVCPYCGRIVSDPEGDRCPGCFTPYSRFLRPA